MTTKKVEKNIKASVYSMEGKKVSEITLPDSIFNSEWKDDLVHTVVVSMQANARAGTAHTKDRSEVRGGGKKPWKQKGTGRARHGSIRSPIWSKGGVAHGPRNEKEYAKKINKNVRARALACVLTKKYEEGQIAFVDSFSFSAPKSKDAHIFLKAIAPAFKESDLTKRKKNSALVVLPSRDENTERSFRNFGNISLVQIKDLNVVELLTYKHVVIVEPKTALDTLSLRTATKTNRKKEAHKVIVKK